MLYTLVFVRLTIANDYFNLDKVLWTYKPILLSLSFLSPDVWGRKKILLVNNFWHDLWSCLTWCRCFTYDSWLIFGSKASIWGYIVSKCFLQLYFRPLRSKDICPRKVLADVEKTASNHENVRQTSFCMTNSSKVLIFLTLICPFALQ